MFIACSGSAYVVQPVLRRGDGTTEQDEGCALCLLRGGDGCVSAGDVLQLDRGEVQ